MATILLRKPIDEPSQVYFDVIDFSEEEAESEKSDFSDEEEGTKDEDDKKGEEDQAAEEAKAAANKKKVWAKQPKKKQNKVGFLKIDAYCLAKERRKGTAAEEASASCRREEGRRPDEGGHR